MAIEFSCPSCASFIRVAESAAGQHVTCPNCALALEVPSPDADPISGLPPSAMDAGPPMTDADPEESLPSPPQWFSSSARTKSGTAITSSDEIRGREIETPADEDAEEISPASVPAEQSADLPTEDVAPEYDPIEVDSSKDEAALENESSEDADPPEVPEPPAFLKKRAAPGESSAVAPAAEPVAMDSTPTEESPTEESPTEEAPAEEAPAASVAWGEPVAVLPSAPPAAAPRPSIARKLKRRNRRKKSIPWTPIIGVAILLGAIGWFSWEGGPGLGGELQAEALYRLDVPPAYVDSGSLELTQSTIDVVLGGLEEAPQAMSSRLIWTGFESSPRGLRVRLAEGRETIFYRVDVAKNAKLRRYAAENAERLDEPRIEELRDAARRFFKEWERADSLVNPISDLASYRDSLALAALVGPLGYHTIAVYEDHAYRCVYEDPDGNLYFLLPEGVEEFELRGRRVAGGEQMFSGDYTVNVVPDSSN